MQTNKILLLGAAIFVVGLLLSVIVNIMLASYSGEEQVSCTLDAMQCPDGSYVGRTGQNCEFVCPPSLTTQDDWLNNPDSMKEQIRVDRPYPTEKITSPLQLSGQAVGSWFFEASAPVVLVNWDGLIIAEGYITARGDWMTTEFVPFSGTLEFVSPYLAGDPEFMSLGAIIFKKDNPSGLSEHDNAMEIPILFAEANE